MQFLEKFRRARIVGTPLIAIACPDPSATMTRIQTELFNTSAEPGQGRLETPVIQWDIIDGWRMRNKAGQEAIEKALDALNADQVQTINPVESLKIAAHLPEQTVLFMLNVHHFMDAPAFLQALWNLRDNFKSKTCSVCMIGPEFTLPEQLHEDVFMLDEPLPDTAELKRIVCGLIEGTELESDLDPNTVEAATDALRGLSAFPAEQSVAMNLRKIGLDIDGLWDRKRKLISSTPGLRVYTGPEKFEAIGGCDQIKSFMRGVINGKEAPNVIVFIDEGEKMFAGASGDANDSSGVSQDFLATTLSYMEDNECDGAIFVGPPGAAKSAIAKATGNEAGVPTIMLDLGGMKGGLVGKSEQQLRAAYKVITAVGGGKAFFVMTCNKIVELPPELRRRFTSGIFFFDLPSKEERDIIWDIYMTKYGFGEGVYNITDINFDAGWTGAEIRNCCRMAYRQSIPITQAAKYIVPVAKAAATQIQSLRRQASGAYLSANEEGVYTWEDTSQVNVAAPHKEK